MEIYCKPGMSVFLEPTLLSWWIKTELTIYIPWKRITELTICILLVCHLTLLAFGNGFPKKPTLCLSQENYSTLPRVCFRVCQICLFLWSFRWSGSSVKDNEFPSYKKLQGWMKNEIRRKVNSSRNWLGRLTCISVPGLCGWVLVKNNVPNPRLVWFWSWGWCYLSECCKKKITAYREIKPVKVEPLLLKKTKLDCIHFQNSNQQKRYFFVNRILTLPLLGLKEPPKIITLQCLGQHWVCLGWYGLISPETPAIVNCNPMHSNSHTVRHHGIISHFNFEWDSL